jgi:hypothetical protein
VTDLVQRLRASVTQARALDRAALLHEAADEIERLRLTDAERKATTDRLEAIMDRESDTPEPVAYAVLGDGYEYVAITPERCVAWADENGGRTVPLYASPQPTLTDEEREAIAEAAGAYNDNDDDEECARIAATLHGILKRLG